MNRLSSVVQFILGFLLGVLLLIAGTTALAYVVFARLNAAPPKPIFAEEKPKTEATTKPKATPKPQASNVKPKEENSTQSKEQPAKKVTEEKPKSEVKKEEKKETLPAGAYQGKVTWSEGLSLRSDPSTEAERVGGVGYNSNIIILEKSADGQWQKVRIPESGQEGWVKAGNVQKAGE